MQGYEWPCNSLLEGFLCSSLKHHCLSRNRSAARGDFIIPSATKNITYRRQRFAVDGPTLWNSLPIEIRSFSSLPMFRSRLNTYLFREAYTISAP